MSRTIAEIYLEEYLNERYEILCKELLSKSLDAHFNLKYRKHGLTFSNIFVELIFVSLYDKDSFEEFQDNLITVIIQRLQSIPDNEVNLLYLKSLDSFGFEVFDSIFPNENKACPPEISIAREVLTLVNKELIEYLSSISEDKYSAYENIIIEDIKEFAFDGPLSGDYNFRNFWEEYCFIIQEGDGFLYDLFYDTIFDHINNKITKIPSSEMKVLYSISDDIYIEDHQYPFPSMGDMVDYITNKLFDMVSWTASREYIEYEEEDDVYEEDEL